MEKSAKVTTFVLEHVQRADSSFQAAPMNVGRNHEMRFRTDARCPRSIGCHETGRAQTEVLFQA
jgi:hypothetical protein